MTIKDVHTEHCCSEHGCKYGDKDCTVVTGKAPQSYPCEWCGLKSSEHWTPLDEYGSSKLLGSIEAAAEWIEKQCKNK